MNNKSFWWDVYHRHLQCGGKSIPNLKKLKDHEIQRIMQLNHLDFNPVSDIDRPMTPSELLDFSRHPNVIIGGHTEKHSILTNYNYNEQLYRVNAGNCALSDIIGRKIDLFAYPNGNYCDNSIRALVN